ncbi:hypothetical protein AGMMS49928_10580 [Spirochaetia bacterium]|nr:hypothetical protein AGMMS49928_10580 [Spirochaetia bacterium]
MMKHFIPCVFLLFFTVFATGLGAQQNTVKEVEILLGTSEISWEQTVRFVLEAADAAVFTESAEAFDFVLERGWAPKNARLTEPVRLSGLSLLLMRSFDLKGGMFYSLFKNSHYAYRELIYKDILLPGSDPAMLVSGERLLYLVGKILALTEERDEKQAARERRNVQAESEKERLAAELAAREEAERQRIRAEAEKQHMAEELNARITQGSGAAAVSTRIEVVEEGVSISLNNLRFQADDATLTATEKNKLQEIAGVLETLPRKKLLVAGHTALAGNEEGRLTVSRTRAQAVADYLIQLGIRGRDEIEVRGYGAERPIADNASPEGMARNRRVEIIILE